MYWWLEIILFDDWSYEKEELIKIITLINNDYILHKLINTLPTEEYVIWWIAFQLKIPHTTIVLHFGWYISGLRPLYSGFESD